MNTKEKRTEIIKLVVVYVIILAAMIAVSNGVFWGAYLLGFEMPMIASAILNELAIIIPTLVFIKLKGDRILDSLGFHSIRPSTIFLSLLLALLSVPVYSCANAFSQFFVPNVMAQATSELSTTAGISTIIVTLMAPLAEEIVFRGFFARRFNILIGLGFATVISAIMFGVCHMNINQFCYALVLGIIFALADYAADSIWPSIIMHMAINAFGIAVLFLSNADVEAAGMDFGEAAETARTTGNIILYVFIVTGIMTVFCVFLIRLVLRAIAKRQNNEVAIATFSSKKDKVKQLKEA